MSVLITYPFTSEPNYDFDANLIEISGGSGKLKSQIPVGVLLGSNFSIDQNASWAMGSRSGSLFGGATVSGGKLNLLASNDSYLEYDGINNTPPANTGCVRFTFTPNYSGSKNCILFSSSDAENDKKNLIRIMQSGTSIRYDIYNSTGSAIQAGGAWNLFHPVAGTLYEIELNFDVILGEIRLFINGVLSTGLHIATGTRDNNSTLIRIGKSHWSSSNVGCDGTIENLFIFDSVQHTANYTPGVPVPNKYSILNPFICPKSTASATEIISFIETITQLGNDQIRFAIVADGIERFFNTISGKWENSTGYSQSNSGSEIDSNAASLKFNSNVFPKVYLHSEDGIQTPTIDNISLQFNFNPPAILINTLNVFGYLHNPDGTPDINAQVWVYPESASTVTGQNSTENKSIVKALVDEDGGWDVSLIPSDSIGGTKYVFKFIPSKSAGFQKTKTVIGANQVRYEDLI